MARDTTFYYAFLVLPPEKRRAIVALWDFCRAVDDAVDLVEGAGRGEGAATRAAHARLDRWRAELARCYEAGRPETPEGRALRPVVARFNLPRRAFEDLLDGVAMDIGYRRYPTFADLHQYCQRVASAVGLVCLEVFGYRNGAARDYAVHLGVALQLTNIIRDVASDLAKGRLYLPLEDLERFGVGEADLAAGVVSESVRVLVGYQCERARTFYARAAATLPREDARRLVAAEIMRALYAALLRRVERARYDVFSERLRVPRPEQLAIAFFTWARTMVAPG